MITVAFIAAIIFTTLLDMNKERLVIILMVGLTLAYFLIHLGIETYKDCKRSKECGDKRH